MKAKTIVALVLAVVLLVEVEVEVAEADTAADPPAADPPTNISQFCKDKCTFRCLKAGRKDRCLFYCGICCNKCHCVPPGTFGNKDKCPCYRDLKNSKGGPKCP